MCASLCEAIWRTIAILRYILNCGSREAGSNPAPAPNLKPSDSSRRVLFSKGYAVIVVRDLRKILQVGPAAYT